MECTESADCCADFVPDANCAVYQESCESNPTLCLAFNTLCVCNQTCVQDQCYDGGPGCTVDDHCASANRPYCAENQCVACREHGDCGGGSERCIEGACVEPCVNDEQCPMLESCMEGSCTYRGCESDRECVLLLADGRAVCREAACEVACALDWECDVAAREVCHQGACVFAGCETNADCRIFLDIENEQSPNVHAECR